MLGRVIAGRLAARPELAALYRDWNGAMGALEDALRATVATRSADLTGNLTRLLCSGGKRLRPALAWLCHRAGGGTEYPVLPLMTMLELMHTASLIHDDVVDGADSRRGSATIHRVLDRRRAVQCGDFLLARAMELLHQYRGTGINEMLAQTSREMCLGELCQMSAAGRLDGRTQAEYFLQMKRKTAYLLAASCHTGAVAGGMEARAARCCNEFGLHLGLAFQLRDDLLDFAPTAEFGKAAGQDLRRGIFTLPVLYALEHSPSPAMAGLLERPDKTEEELQTLIASIIGAGGLEHTQRMLEAASRDAAAALAPMPDTPERAALMEMAETLAGRTQ